MNHKNISPVVLADEKCCGHDLLWQGDLDSFEKLARYNVKLFRDAGVKTLVFSCAEGYYTWKYEYAKLFNDRADFDFEIYHISEYILKMDLLEGISFLNLGDVKVTYHDACRLGRLGGKLYDAPRELLKQLPGVDLIEMENIKDDANCCGISSYLSCNEFSRELRKRRIEEAVDTGADFLIVPCPKCLAHLNCYLNDPCLSKELKEIKNKIKIIDLSSFLGKRLSLI